VGAKFIAGQVSRERSIKRRANRLVLISVWVTALLCGNAFAQPRQTDRINTLIKTLEDQNEFVVLDASRKLIRIGPRVIPPLIQSLKQNKNCDFQFYAVEVIRKVDPTREIVKPTLIDVARGNCELSPGTHAALVHHSAISVLIEQIRGGIPLVAGWLGDEDIRTSAAIAFDGLASLIQQRRLPRTRTKEMIGATKAAIPMLRKVVDDADKTARCRAYAALWRMQRSGYRELSVPAGRALEGITDRCE
jgi:HEAT repeat protein